MTAEQKRQAVCDKYAMIIGRNIYSQDLRDYCFRKYSDGRYYSDCSSSICYAYKEAGEGFGILNTAGIYQSSKLTTVEVTITSGIPNTAQLRPGDMLEFAGTDSSRPLKIGHVEMYCGNGIICGHGSGTPSYKDIAAYCKSRYNSWAPGGWRKGLVCVRRYIQDDEQTEYTLGWKKDKNGWWYADSKTTYYKSCWQIINGHKYYFNPDGYAVIGWQVIDGQDFYFEPRAGHKLECALYVSDQDGAQGIGGF